MVVGNIREHSESAKIKLGSTGKLYLLVLLSVVLSGVSVLFGIVNASYVRTLTKKQFPTLVQTNSGETIEIEFKDPTYRSSETIKSYVSNTLYHLMTMTSYGSGSAEVSALNPERKMALPIKVEVGSGSGTKGITQTAWLASEALESNFADEFRIKLAEMTPPDIFTGVEEVILKIDYLREPEKVVDNRGQWQGFWTVDVIGNLKVYRVGQGEVKTIAFNKRVTVRPIEAPKIHDVKKYGLLAVALNAAQRSGLQITDVKDIRLAESY